MAARKKLQPPTWSPPKQFDEYRILWQLGRGGMGEVYLGHDTLLDRPVAIKFISAIEPDALMREQFLTEARAAARLQHPNVVTIYRVGEIDGRPYIISEFVRGQNLDHIKLPLPWARALELSIGLARGLAAAHRRGVLHRDIKPGNVILPADGEVKLLDFGLAKFVEAGVMQELLTEGPEPVRLDMTAPTLDIKAASSLDDTPALTLMDTPIAGVRPLSETGPDFGQPSANSAVRVQYGALMTGDTGQALPLSRTSFPPMTNDSDGIRSLHGDSPGSLSNSGIKGTPLYMAPEVLNGEPASRRSDIYSMGALLYELCTGAPPHYDPLASLEDLRTTVNTKDAPPLAGLVPNIEPRFAAVIERCLRRRPGERFASGEELRDALEQIADSAKKDEIPAGNPYRGLLPFEAEHRSLFFGRKSEIGTLVDRLRTEAFVLIAADSGVGKSSVCRAGVLPLVAEGALGGNRAWRQVTLVPGRRPLASLASALSWVLSGDEEQLATELRQDPTQLPRILNRQIGDGRGLVIFIDQMEELITIGDKDEVAIVGEALAALAGRAGNVRLLGTVRSDFLARLATVPALGEEISRALYILRPLGPEKIREVIVGPAHKKSVSFESEALVTHIVESTASADGSLPLLQFALAELWEVKSGDIITAQALESIGGVEGALARHADHVLGRLPPDQRASARRILMNLVTLEGTRARRSEEELVRDGPAARGALEALVRGRLLVARDTPEGAAYEVAHEALIKGWDTLRKWLEEHAESRAVKQRLESAAADWVRLARPKDVLWSRRQIDETRLLEESDIGPRETEFLAASRVVAERRRRLQRVFLASIPVLLVVLYGAVRLLAARDLDKRIAVNVDAARQLIGQAQTKDAEVEKLRRQAFMLFDEKKRDPAEEAWAAARKNSDESDRLYTLATGKLEAALSLDNSRRDVRAQLAESLYSRAVIADREYESKVLTDLLQRMRLYDVDGAIEQKWNAPARITVATDPQDAQVRIERYVADERGHLRLQGGHELGPGPIADYQVEPGSYLLTVRAIGRVTALYPMLVGRGERLSVRVPLLESRQIPAGFVYVPPGRFLFGAAGEETLRQKFFSTAPAHQVTTEGYLISAHETTFAEYIQFLDSLPADKLAAHIPKAGATGAMSGSRVELKSLGPGRWQLVLQPMTVLLTVSVGEPFVYPARQRRVRQDWTRFPVSGVARVDGEAYAAWLHRTGRVPGAHLCTELEWERAARGADERELPVGSSLDPDDANIDVTYDKKPEAMGPDEVGSHPGSRSPFGVEDLTGNAYELTVSSLAEDETVGRGGSFIYDSLAGRSVNRNSVDANFRAPDVGIRICASVTRGGAAATSANL